MGLERLNLQSLFTNKLITVCQKTGQQMSTDNFVFQPVTEDSNDIAVWWFCSNCIEWHLTIYKPESSRE